MTGEEDAEREDEVRALGDRSSDDVGGRERGGGEEREEERGEGEGGVRGGVRQAS